MLEKKAKKAKKGHLARKGKFPLANFSKKHFFFFFGGEGWKNTINALWYKKNELLWEAGKHCSKKKKKKKLKGKKKNSKKIPKIQTLISLVIS